MAGGSNSNFWPLSRSMRPKPFMDVLDQGNTLIQACYRRCRKLVPSENIIVVTHENYAALALEQMPDIPPRNILAEPYSKKTAPCIALATYEILRRDPEAVIVVTPADIVILEEGVFVSVIGKALDYVQHNDVLMTIGIPPTRPDTNYGYIQVEGGADTIEKEVPVKVRTFTEKPPEGLAEVFWRSGEFLWNSGIFVWKGQIIREEMESYIPEITGLFYGWQEALGSDGQKEFLDRVYADCDTQSIDYGVMEKTSRAWVMPADLNWADVNSWQSLYKNYPYKDECGNIVAPEKGYIRSSRDNVLLATNPEKLLAIKGLNGFLVVDTDDVLLICPKDDREFKEFIAGIGMPGYEKYR